MGEIPFACVDFLGQRGQLPQRLPQGGMVWMQGRRVLEEVAKEEHVAWDSLDRLDQEVVQGETALAVPRPLLQVGAWRHSETTK